ncbi:MAG: hypothetical protein AB1461_01685 [Thermodesulfobacteriota bacterium]
MIINYQVLLGNSWILIADLRLKKIPAPLHFLVNRAGKKKGAEIPADQVVSFC